jgi:chromosome segregation ATPase
MPDTDTFLNRIGRIFKRAPGTNGGDNGDREHGPSVTVEAHPLTLRPWRKNTAAIAQLQGGFQSLSSLMDEIRQHMVAQGRRQDELINYLSALPKLMEAIPENNRIQGETLKAIQEQLQHHADQEQTLGEILEKMSESGGEQRDLLEGMRERVETMHDQDKAMADSLNSVSATLEQASRHSAAGTQVLQTLRENLRARDGELQRVIQRQNTRLTVLLIAAICFSAAALAAVLGIAYASMHGWMK